MITLLTTGGTFDKIYFDANSEFSIGDPQAIPMLKEANVDVRYRVESVLKKDSLDLTDEDRQRLHQQVTACDDQHIIMTHGTDTMVTTGKYLADKGVDKEKTIVLVGAMQPARMRYTDATFNLGFAFAAVQLLAPGIYLAMNGRVFPYDHVEKNRTAGKFESID